MSSRLYMKLYKSLLFFSIVLFLFSCDKEKKLLDNTDPNKVNFLITLPSYSIAQFAAKCTNYDIILDTVIFISPENTVYFEGFYSDTLQKNEGFLAGSWMAEDGIWILNFKGKTQLEGEVFSSSVPFVMNLDDEEEYDE